MSLKQNLADQLKAQSDIWRAQAKDYQERMEQAGEKARGEYKKAMEQMESKIQEAVRLAEQVRSANEAAWKDRVTASQKAFAEMQRGWAEANDRPLRLSSWNRRAPRPLGVEVPASLLARADKVIE